MSVIVGNSILKTRPLPEHPEGNGVEVIGFGVPKKVTLRPPFPPPGAIGSMGKFSREKPVTKKNI